MSTLLLAYRFLSPVSALEFVIGHMHLIRGHMEALNCQARLDLRYFILAFRILEWLSYSAFQPLLILNSLTQMHT